MNLSKICSKVIEVSFHILFFLVPLVLCPLNFELFEYNKMMLTYAICIVICTAWVLKMVSEKRFYIRKTPLDIPLFLFLLSQIISTFFSIDPHTSIFGYYSRFHGGLLSTISYVLLYYALVSNFKSEKSFFQPPTSLLSVISLLKTALFSAALVAIYGILEHPSPLFRDIAGNWHGIDYQYWVQDVELRVFSTIGQPNWLAAYLSIVIPVAVAFMLVENSLRKKSSFLLLASCFYLCLLFTNSRAGAAGLFVGLSAFLILLFLKYLTLRTTARKVPIHRDHVPAPCSNRIGIYGAIVFPSINKKVPSIVFSKQNLIFLSLLLVVFGTLTLVSGKFLIRRFAEITPKGAPREKQEEQGLTGIGREATIPVIPAGETGRIRNIVWKGAVEIFKNYPLFGSGVETFAYSYYQFRPKEHNLTTEWDFLYNKAHNEYLNFLATTGLVGLSTYLLIIFTFLCWSLKKLLSKPYTLYPIPYTLISALLFGYIAYLVQNFYSFSVVPTATFFFLFPGVAFVLADSVFSIQYLVFSIRRPAIRWTLDAITIFIASLSLFILGKMWLADTNFAKARSLAQSGYFDSSYLYATRAITYNPSEPLYFDQLAYDAAILATSAKEATTSAILAQEAVSASQRALTTSPLNINFWKTAIKVLYQLGSLNQEFYSKALEATKIAIELSPTEPKLPYNLGLIHLKLKDQERAVEAFKKAIDLKPDLRDPHYALAAVYYEQATKDDKIVNEELSKKAIFELEYILNNIDHGDVEAQAKLREWKE